MNENNISILLVDDDPVLLAAYVKHLQCEGFSVDTAENGRRALQKTAEAPKKYHFVITNQDIGDPDWDGFKTTEEILKINRDIAVIIFSNAHNGTNNSDKQRALKAGAIRYEIKDKETDITPMIKGLVTEVRTLKELRSQLHEFTEKQQWLPSLLGSNMGTMIIDRNGRIHYMNQYLQNLLPDAGNPPLSLYHLVTGNREEFRPFKHNRLQDIFDGKHEETETLYFFTPVKGKWQYQQIFASPLKDSKDNILKGSDHKPIALILNSRLLDVKAVEQLDYKLRLEAVVNYLWQDFDHVRLYFAEPDISKIRLLCAPGQEELINRVFDYSDDPCVKWCITKGTYRIWDKKSDAGAEQETITNKMHLPGLKQWLDYPLFLNDEPIGWISLDNADSQSPVREDSLELLKTSAEEIIAIYNSYDFNAQINPELIKKAGALTALDIKLSTIAKNPIEGLELIIKEIIMHCGANEAFFRYLKHDELILGPGVGAYYCFAFKRTPLSDTHSLTAIAARSGKPFIIRDTSDVRFQERIIDYKKKYGAKAAALNAIKSSIYFPIKLGTLINSVIVVHFYKSAGLIPDYGKINSFLDGISTIAALLINDYIPYIELQSALMDADNQKQRFKTFLMDMGDEVSIINKDDIIVFANDAKRQRFQKAGEDIADGHHKCWQVFESRTARCAVTECPCTRAREEKHVVSDIMRIAYDQAQLPFYSTVTASPIKLSDGTVDEVIEVCRDVTHAKRKERELEASEALSGNKTAGFTTTQYLEQACALIKAVLPAQICSIYLWDPEWYTLALQVTTCPHIQSIEQNKYYYDHKASGIIVNLHKGEPIRGAWKDLSLAKEDKIVFLYAQDSPEPLSHYLHIPLKIAGKEAPLGMIEVVNKIIADRPGYCRENWGKPFRLDKQGFSPEDQAFLQGIGDQISIWVYNQQLLEEQQQISNKLKILTKTVVHLSQVKTLEEIAYLTLVSVTHKEGLSHNRAFLALPHPESEQDFIIYAIVPKKKAEEIWKKVEDYEKILTQFREQGVPGKVLWNIKRFKITESDLENSFLIEQTRKNENKIWEFKNLPVKDKNNYYGDPQYRMMSKFDRKILGYMKNHENFYITIFPIFEKEESYLLVDNSLDKKQLTAKDKYLLTQYSYSLSAAIQRWYNTAKFKELAGKTAHEIRGVLQSISSNNELFTPDIQAADVQKQQQEIEHQVKKGSNIVMTFIENIKIESIYWELKKEPVSLKAIIEQAVRSIALEAYKAGITITIPEKADITIILDPLKMEMVLINLLRNAIKATPPKLEASRKQITITFKEVIPDIVITIQDQGIGMTLEEANTIFVPFKGKGTGLGITLSHEIVKRHKGKLNVASEIAKGTTIEIILPKE